MLSSLCQCPLCFLINGVIILQFVLCFLRQAGPSECFIILDPCIPGSALIRAFSTSYFVKKLSLPQSVCFICQAWKCVNIENLKNLLGGNMSRGQAFKKVLIINYWFQSALLPVSTCCTFALWIFFLLFSLHFFIFHVHSSKNTSSIAGIKRVVSQHLFFVMNPAFLCN